MAAISPASEASLRRDFEREFYKPFNTKPNIIEASTNDRESIDSLKKSALAP